MQKNKKQNKKKSKCIFANTDGRFDDFGCNRGIFNDQYWRFVIPAPTNRPTMEPTCLPVTRLIYFEPFNNFTLWTASTIQNINITNIPESVVCIREGNTPLSCVRMTTSGIPAETAQTYLIRSSPNNYQSYELELDVVTFSGSSNLDDFCSISYSFNNNNWIQLGSVRRLGTHLRFLNERYTFSNNQTSENNLFIKLEAVRIGRSIPGSDIQCFFDNVFLYGSNEC